MPRVYSQHQLPSFLHQNASVITSFGIVAIRENTEHESVAGPLYDNPLAECSVCNLQRLRETCLQTFGHQSPHHVQHHTNAKYSILMLQRTHTNAYVDIVRGKYTSKYLLPYLISELTCDEKKRLITVSFYKMWKDMYGHLSVPSCSNTNTNVNTNFTFPSTETEGLIQSEKEKLSCFDYWKGLMKFETHFTQISQLVLASQTHHLFPECGFPKGRKDRQETGKQCALREFCEETGLKAQDVYLLNTKEPIIEEFIGSDNQFYRHIYYLAFVSADGVVGIDSSDAKQCCEVSNLGWYPYQTAHKTFRQYDRTKHQVLYQAKQLFKYHYNIHLDSQREDSSQKQSKETEQTEQTIQYNVVNNTDKIVTSACPSVASSAIQC